ncbi:MAG: 16S rRNA (adenine(1518)-N(6)/adenine(1519)-N(6))-dimethyltransferase RsmA [Lachnospiraceae bacterium]|nr:16S rRNA (adenine(1518)-N(6)/adenine(1519)-N(6))-dimethyltransferase RsmA [Lachnospiraceae bacterium]
MNSIGTTSKTLEIIKKYDFVFQKKYGQNFLTDHNILDKIVSSAQVNKNDHIIEIGPGIGTLTEYLCQNAGSVTAIEIDPALIPILNDTLSEFTNLNIVNIDVLKFDIKKYIEENVREESVKVVANLPYYITTPIIMKLLEEKLPLKSITVMVQTEVAKRMQTGPGSKDYGALSLAVGYYSDPKITATVPPNCFIPRPKVGSSVIRLDIYKEPPIKVKDEEHMFRLIRAAFNQRRKTLANSLSNDSSLELKRDEVCRALSQMGLDERIRGEALTLKEFALLSDILKNSENNNI